MRSLTFVFLVIALLAVPGRPVWAQIGGGEVNGLVIDTQAAAVPGATVTATHTATGVTRPTVSNFAGACALPGLPPGFGAATFGVISAAGDPRVVQLAAKFLF